MRNERLGYILGFIAVCGFALGLPMARFALSELDPVMVGMGRALCAAILAAAYLVIVRSPIPDKKFTWPLLSVGLGVSIGFPLLSSLALQYVPASHGAIVTGLLPLATAYWVSLTKHERPSSNFWRWGLLGCVSVVGYSLYKSGGVIHLADVLLLLTVILGGMGYAYGAVAARTIGGIRVMCWGLVYVSPVLALCVIPKILHGFPQVSFKVWGAFVYLVLVSQLLGMMLWYKALSLGSIARLSQIQLIQPFLTIILASLFFGEVIDHWTIMATLMVVVSIYFSKKQAVTVH